MMEYEQLKRLIREYYPFPIAHAHKKVVGLLENDMRKLKCIIQTAEITAQFLALLAVAQVRQDLLEKNLPAQDSLSQDIKLRNPSFGTWSYLTSNLMKAYRDVKGQLIVPELFDFCFQESSDGELQVQPVQTPIIESLRILRNNFHHPGIPENKIQESVVQGLEWLHQLLEAVRFLASYSLLFTQEITLNEGSRQTTYYTHKLTRLTGCFSTFSEELWKSGIHLKPYSVVFLQDKKYLILDPFIIYTERLKGVPDVLLLNNFVQSKPIYLSSLFDFEWVTTEQKGWKEGKRYQSTLRKFFRQLRAVEPAEESDETEDEEAAIQTTAEVFEQRYRPAKSPVQHTSPYKFLDYYNPEDRDIFFGRDKEIRLLQQKFHNSRLLVLHGESGTGKTSLIRAGLIPRLDSESYIPVYVRVLREPLYEIKRELIRQLGLEDHDYSSFDGGQGGVNKHPVTRSTRQPGFPLAEFLVHVTERVSKTVVIVLDQFEEFFLRFPEEVREQFEKEFAACVETSRLDAKFLISLRADYFSHLATFEDSMPHIFTHQIQLECLSETQALEAVIKPAEHLGIEVDEAMVQIKLLPELMSDESIIEPPLLQIVCDTLYQNAQSEGRSEIGTADYEAIGDVKGCLGRYLETKLRQFGKHQGMAKAVLKALVTAEGTKRASFAGELLSRIKSISSSPPLVGGVRGGGELTEEELKKGYLDKFVRDRLVRVEDVEGRARYELSHEYLVKHIGDWIEESEREVTKVLEVIDRAYEAYQSTELLLENSALQMIKPFEDQLVLSTDKQTFVNRSKIQIKKQRRSLFLKVAASLMFVALIVGSILGYQTYQAYLESEKQRKRAISQKQQAEEQRKIAEQQTKVAQEARVKAEQQARIARAHQLTTQAQTAFEKYPQRSLLLAVEAIEITLRKDEPRVPAAEQMLRDVLTNTGGIPLNGNVFATNPDNRRLVIRSVDSLAKLSQEYIDSYEISLSSIVLAISPDSHRLVTRSRNDTAQLWDLTAPDPTTAPLVLHSHEETTWTVTFSPDNHWLVTVNVKPVTGNLFNDLQRADHIISRLWDLTTIGPAASPVVSYNHGSSFRLGGYPITAFSPDSHWLVTGGRGLATTARLWDLTVSDPATVPLFPHGHEEVTFSSNNHWLVTRSWDGIARLWDLTAPDPTTVPFFPHGHEEEISKVTFSPDNHWLATGSSDGVVRLWTLRLDELIDLACRTAGRNLSRDEWALYFPGEEYRQTCPDLPIHWSFKE